MKRKKWAQISCFTCNHARQDDWHPSTGVGLQKPLESKLKLLKRPKVYLNDQMRHKMSQVFIIIRPLHANTMLYMFIPSYAAIPNFRNRRTKPHGSWSSDHRASRWAAEGWRESHFCVEGTDLDTNVRKKYEIDTRSSYMSMIRYRYDIIAILQGISTSRGIRLDRKF